MSHLELRRWGDLVSNNRRLAALMFTDMVGYSALARENEEMARELVDAQRAIVRSALHKHHGREHQTTGDGFFLEFASAVNAVQCAVDIQTAMHERERHQPENRRIKIRIGIHLGDILTNDEDLFGNGVNVAARVEPLAAPGGICVTRQIYDQAIDRVNGVTFEKHGHRNLKNIRGGAEIFHVVMPWQTKPQTSFGAKTWIAAFRRINPSAAMNAILVASVTAICVASLLYALGGAFSSAFASKPVSVRGPAQALLTEPVDLSTGWKFRTSNEAPWEEFETHASWKHAEKIAGPYWMTKTFSVSGDLKEPAIVLGLITDTHRLLLNGKFIGGSDQPGELVFYTFAPELLNREGENTLLIEGHTRRALNPGLIVLPKVGSWLAEFSEIRDRVRENDLKFHFLRNTYFGLSLLIFTAAFLFSIFRKSSTPYLYSSLILLLGTLGLAYYSPWISSGFEYPFLRFMKVISLTHVPIFLASAALRLSKKSKFETLNNAFALAFLIFISWSLLARTLSPTAFIANYNLLLGVGAIYALGASTWMTVRFLQRDSNQRPNESRLTTSFHFTYWIFGLLSFATVFCAVKTSPDFVSNVVESVTTPKLRLLATEVGMSLPFLFSLFIVSVGLLDYRAQTRNARRKRHRDQLMLELVRLMASTKPFGDVIASLQKEMCEFVRAERSTLYVLESEAAVLSAEYLHGARPAKFEIKQRASTKTGIMGYALDNQTPLLIPDIRRDSRFFGPGASYPVEGFESYRTGSCMLFPLLSQGRVVGLVTFADKQGASSFTKDDFEVALELSSSLGLLLDNQQMRRAIDGSRIA